MKKLVRQESGNMSLLFKIIWGLGNFGGGLIGGVVGAYQLIYYQNYLGMPAHLYTLAIIIYTVYNAINDPIMGYISDNTKSKHGRRVPYFRASAPFIVVSFVLLFCVPIQANPMLKFWWLLLTLVVYDLGFTMYFMMYTALSAEITEHENERADLQLSYNGFAFIGSIIGMVLPSLINPDFTSLESVVDFRTKIIIIGVVGLIFMFLTAFNVKERIELRKDIKEKESKGLKNVFIELFSVLKIKPLRIAIFINFFFRAYSALITALLYYIAFFVLNVDPTIFTLSVMVPLGVGLPVWVAIQRKIGNVKTLQLSILGSTIGLFTGSLLSGTLAIVIFAFSGFCVAGINLTMNMLIFDCVDYDEMLNGTRREGTIFGANAFIMVFSFATTTIIPYVLQFTGFITAEQNGGVDLMTQPVSAVWGIRGMVIFCALLMLIAYFLILKYPLKGEKLKNMRAEILKRHEVNTKVEINN